MNWRCDSCGGLNAEEERYCTECRRSVYTVAATAERRKWHEEHPNEVRDVRREKP